MALAPLLLRSQLQNVASKCVCVSEREREKLAQRATWAELLLLLLPPMFLANDAGLVSW